MNETYNPFVQIIKSFVGYADTDEFYTLRRQLTPGKIICALIITVILNLITFGIGAANLCTNKNVANFISDIPDFYYVSGELTVTEKYESNEADVYIIVDTDAPYYYSGGDNGGHSDAVSIDSTVKSLSEKSSMRQALFVSSSNFVQVNFLTGQVQSLTYEELSRVFPIKTLSKQMVQEGYKGFIIKWAVIIGLIYIPFQLAGLFISTLIYSLVALVAKSIIRKEHDFSTLYWISFYMYIPIVICKTVLKTFIPSGRLINVAGFMFFAGMILRVLKNDDPQAKANEAQYAASVAIPSAFDPNDDLDAYMKETEPDNTDTTAFSDSAYNTSDDYYNKPETTSSSSGLSLKSHDD